MAKYTRLPAMDPAAFPGRLRHLREAAGLSVAELARRADLARQFVYALESGAKVPSWPTVCSLASALGCGADDFR